MNSKKSIKDDAHPQDGSQHLKPIDGSVYGELGDVSVTDKLQEKPAA
jgi:hypothetical protein